MAIDNLLRFIIATLLSVTTKYFATSMLKCTVQNNICDTYTCVWHIWIINILNNSKSHLINPLPIWAVKIDDSEGKQIHPNSIKKHIVIVQIIDALGTIFRWSNDK